MKTNQNMIRKMGNFDVIQRTKDSMFNATQLLKQWNKYSGQKKMMSHFLENISTKEFIKVLENDNDTSYRNSVIMKSRANKGINAGTWMHPYLFIDFAMWLNPKFKLEVIKFVYDQLIKFRHDAGDNYRKLCNALGKFSDVEWSEVGKMLNFVVFDDHEKGLRNKATSEQENDLQQLERDMCRFIEMGFVNSYAQFKKVLRKEWHKRHGKVPVVLT
jgi:hypothetical protein